MTVVLATVTRGDVRMEYMSSVFDAYRQQAFDRIILKEGKHYLDDARNSCVDTFLGITDSDDDILLFVDDDQTFTKTDIDTLLAKATPMHRVMAGWYLSTVQNNVQPVVYNWGPHERFGEHYLSVSVDDIREAQRDDCGYVPVEAVGTGFMAIRRTLLVDMLAEFKQPAPFAELMINGVHCGEDLSFCRRVRAMSESVYIHPDVHVGHIKTINLKEQV